LALLANAIMQWLASSAMLAEPPLNATPSIVPAVRNSADSDNLIERIQCFTRLLTGVEGRAA
jgi:hypothetical protein